MKRRINSTGRHKLGVDCVAIRLNDASRPSDPRTFTATLSLPTFLSDKPGAAIYLEPYVRSSTMRFSWGTVGAMAPPVNTALSDLDPGPVLFRVKVVDESPGAGRILAAADRIRPHEDIQDGDSRKSLLPLVQRDLGERIWELDNPNGARPVLVINNRVPAIRDRLMTDPILQGAIFPHAIKGVFETIFFDDEVDEDTEWAKDWQKFGSELLGRELPADLNHDEDHEELERLVSELVEAFCSSRTFARKAREKEEGIAL